MGVHIFPLLIKLLIKGRIDSSCVHVVPSWDDEIASVPGAELPNGFCNLLLVVMPRTPISDGNEVNIVMTGELNLNMLKFESNANMIDATIVQPDYLYTCQCYPRTERKNWQGKVKWSKVRRSLEGPWCRIRHWCRGTCCPYLYLKSLSYSWLNSAEILDLPIQGKRCVGLSLSLSSLFVKIHQRFPRSMTSNLYIHAHSTLNLRPFSTNFFLLLVVIVFNPFTGVWQLDLLAIKPSWTFPQMSISIITHDRASSNKIDMRLPRSQSWCMF